MFRVHFASRLWSVLILSVVGFSLALDASVALAKPKTDEVIDQGSIEIEGQLAFITTSHEGTAELHGLVTNAPGTPFPDNLHRRDWVRVLDPLYASISQVNTRLFVTKSQGWPTILTEVILKHKGSKYSVEKETLTPYNEMQVVGDKVLVGRTLLGKPRDISDALYNVDVFDEKGAVATTLHNVKGNLFLCSDNVMVGTFVDSAFQELHGLTDLKGNLIAPLIPNLQFLSAYTPAGKEKTVMAVPLDEKREYWMPLRDDGTTPIDPRPSKGYLSPFAPNGSGKNLEYWLKEFETESGPALGWVSPSLKEETGPKWKSIGEVIKGFPLKETTPGALLDQRITIGQLLDGRWMGYDQVFVKDPSSSYEMVVFKPLLDTPAPTQEAMLQAVTPIFTARGDRIMQKAQEEAKVYDNWKEETKKFYGCDTGQDLYSDACTTRRKTLEDYNEALRNGWADRAYNAAKALGGDDFIKFMLLASQRHFYNVEPEILFNLASSAKDSALAVQVKARYNELLEERKRAAETVRVAAEKPKEWTPTPWPTSGWASMPSWAPSSSAPSLAEHQQTLDNYLRDYKSWCNGSLTYQPKSPF